MNNEIGRKITSLTLMTILLTWGFSAVAPSVIPEAQAANANLFVSAENSQFQNHFGGPMVIEVVIVDSSINRTNEGVGEPIVTINGNQLRMAQGTDGNWYGYFADRAMAQKADATAAAVGIGGNGTGLDFGVFCSAASAATVLGPAFTQTVGVALARQTVTMTGSQGETSTGSSITTTCTSSNPSPSLHNNVVRENKTLNRGGTAGVTLGQIGLTNSNFWPFIQLYNFVDNGNVVVQYNKGGGIQSTTLKFSSSMDDFAKLDLDRTLYPRNAHVHATITDMQLNIDPTDEDSWTFGTISSNTTTFYLLFDENGGKAGDGKVSNSLSGNLTALMYGDNAVLKINKNAQGTTSILLIQDNDKTQLAGSGDISTAATSTVGAGSQPITIVETAPNTGIFSTYDEADVSQLKTTKNAPRGQSAIVNYNDTPRSLLIGFGSASLNMIAPDAEWNSGEELTVRLVDSDANKNSRSDEDLLLSDPDVDVIPAMRIGTPFTLGVKGTGSPDGYTQTSGTRLQALFLGNFTASSSGSTNNAPSGGTSQLQVLTAGTTLISSNATVQRFSDRAMLNVTATNSVTAVILDTKATGEDLLKSINDPRQSATKNFKGVNYLNLDIRSIVSSGNATVYLVNSTSALLSTASSNTAVSTSTHSLISLVRDVQPQSLTMLNQTAGTYNTIFGGGGLAGIGTSDNISYLINFTRSDITLNDIKPIVVDLFSFGYHNDGILKSERINNYIARVEVEETGDNTGVFEGTLEYIMLNQLNILDQATYNGLTTISDAPSFVVHYDLDFEDAVRVTYDDLGADGVRTQVSAQQDAPTHSGVVSFSSPTYKIADTVLITLVDADLNTDVDLIDIYTVVNSTSDPADGRVGAAGLPVFSNGDPLGRLLQLEFNDQVWRDRSNACNTALRDSGIDTGLLDAGFTLIETGAATGVFTGDFQIPSKVCMPGDTSPRNTQGLNMKVNYYDFRDASGQIIRVGDSATIRSNTGSVTLDKTVYPVPWGVVGNFASSTSNSPDGRSIFPVHLTAIGSSAITAGQTLTNGALTIYVQVNDPDFDVSASGEDTIAQNVTSASGSPSKVGPVKVSVTRGSDTVVLAYAGGDTAKPNGVINVGATPADPTKIRQLGPILETHPSSGIFQFNLLVRYTDGPASSQCPPTSSTGYNSLTGTGLGASTTRFSAAPASGQHYCILQGDILTVEYTDPSDAAGRQTTVTDSATFDLRNGALQSDKSVYIIGSDMILTLIDPDLDLDSRTAETYSLDLIEWDSDAATVTMGPLGQSKHNGAFDPEPNSLRETGKSTGIFQTIIEIPRSLDGDTLERGEEIILEYTDWGPSGAKYVGDEREFINLTIFTSNFGATVELDKKVYTWTDKVYITIIAPDHNFDSNRVDEIGASSADPLRVATRGDSLRNYRLVETGPDTGIFTGEVILTGFTGHQVSAAGGQASGTQGGTGPTNGFLRATENDGLTVSYEFSDRETVVGSALIRWNIGEVMWLEASYPARGTGVVRVIDPDMNLNPEAVDNFRVNVWSDSDAGGISLTVTETSQASGIFEGTVFFTTTDASSGHRLRVAEGDTVTAEYEDRTLPAPYTRADNLRITATSFIGTIVPPLERAPAANPRVVDAFGNTLSSVSVDQQVQITADLRNGQDREQRFAYLVQIQNAQGVTVSLAWITGSLTAAQSFSPALSWTPDAPGTYTATVFVWESVDNPTALSPPATVNINVR